MKRIHHDTLFRPGRGIEKRELRLTVRNKRQTTFDRFNSPFNYETEQNNRTRLKIIKRNTESIRKEHSKHIKLYDYLGNFSRDYYSTDSNRSTSKYFSELPSNRELEYAISRAEAKKYAISRAEAKKTAKLGRTHIMHYRNHNSQNPIARDSHGYIFSYGRNRKISEVSLKPFTTQKRHVPAPRSEIATTKQYFTYSSQIKPIRELTEVENYKIRTSNSSNQIQKAVLADRSMRNTELLYFSKK